MRHKMIAALLYVLWEEKQAEKWGGHQRSSTQGEKAPKKILTAPLPVYIPQLIQTRAKGLEAHCLPRHRSQEGHTACWACVRALTQPARSSRAAVTQHRAWAASDTAPRHGWLVTPQLGEHTQDERSPCLLHIKPQLEPSTGLYPNVSHSQYGQTPADFWNCKEHFHEHTDSSKSAAPQQQLPPQMGTWLQDIHIHSEQHRLIPFQTPTQK